MFKSGVGALALSLASMATAQDLMAEAPEVALVDGSIQEVASVWSQIKGLSKEGRLLKRGKGAMKRKQKAVHRNRNPNA